MIRNVLDRQRCRAQWPCGHQDVSSGVADLTAGTPLQMAIHSVYLLLAFGFSLMAGTNVAAQPAPAARPRDRTQVTAVMVIHSYKDGLSGVRSASPDVHLSIGRDPSGPDEPVLLVEYPAPSGNPAGRDVQCDAEHQDWSAGQAISFQIKPAHAVRLSVSFLDRNGVVYTTWTELNGGAWQQVRIPFDQMRPNPYFQPPDARTGRPIDVSEVKAIAFAPHDQTEGRLAIGSFVVTN